MSTNNNLQSRIDLIENPESRLACVILIDTSASMNGDPIKQVSTGLRRFAEDINADELTAARADVAIIAFNHEHLVIQHFGQTLDAENMALHASGGTKMTAPLDTALEMLEQRKRSYVDNGIPYYRPIMMMITDGKPEHDTSAALNAVSNKIRTAEDTKKLTFFGVGTDSADMETLSMFSNLPPKTLRDTDFVSLFQWLSNSITAISHSQMGEEVNLPPTTGWSRY